jgi:hypothetical protein
MGARNVKLVVQQWSHLPGLPFRALVWMATSSLDTATETKPARQFWGGWDDLAVEVLGRSVPPSMAKDTSASKEERKAARASHEAVRRVIRSLVVAGAIVRVGGGFSGHRARYALQERGAVQAVPQTAAERGTVPVGKGHGPGEKGARSQVGKGHGPGRAPEEKKEHVVQEHSGAVANAPAPEEDARDGSVSPIPEEEQERSDEEEPISAPASSSSPDGFPEGNNDHVPPVLEQVRAVVDAVVTITASAEVVPEWAAGYRPVPTCRRCSNVPARWSEVGLCEDCERGYGRADRAAAVYASAPDGDWDHRFWTAKLHDDTITERN